MKRLLLTCTDLMAIQFMVPHIKYLSENGFSVKLACSVVGDRLSDLKEALDGVAEIETVRLVRSPLAVSNLNGLKDLKRIINREKWDVIWTNEPVMGIMTRLAAKNARKRGTKVVYMVHGFHFYKGAPLLNRVMFYPIEKYCSRLCDMIVTINKEDYERAKTFHSKRVEKINGIGVNTEKFMRCSDECTGKRAELGIPENAFLLLSAGELQPHKNHEVIIRALGELKNQNIYYGICGKGDLLEHLKQVAIQCGVASNVKFFGYRKDLSEIFHCGNAFAHPSAREGLGLALLEAMAGGLPPIASKVRGVTDYIINNENGFLYDKNDVKGFAEGINRYYSSNELCKKIAEKCSETVKKYDINVIKVKIYSIMESLLK